MGIDVGIFNGVAELIKTGVNKFWMDKGEKERLEITKEEMQKGFEVVLKKMNQSGDLKKLELTFKESEAQREYTQKHFGSAETLKTFTIGKVIMMGRASIRWVILGFAGWQTHRIVTILMTDDIIKALANGELKASMVWLITLLVVSIVGIPLFYVTGISIEKLFKSRGVI